MPALPVLGEVRILKIVAHIDGAARGNPGPAGYGAALHCDDGRVLELSGYLGETTNNVAEYAALVEALRIAVKEGAEELEINSDSLLLVNQMLGSYRVKHPNLIPLFERAQILKRSFRAFAIRHVPRAQNKDADRLANLAIDRQDDSRVEVRDERA